MNLCNSVSAYANAVGLHGPDSREAYQIRMAHADNKAFLEYADAVDRVKRRLGGRKSRPMVLDWEGVEVIGPESPNTLVKAWEITPHIDKGFDHALIRDYRKAVRFAERLVDHLMDNADVERSPIEIKIRVVEVAIEDLPTDPS